jgi:hypothetical protein
VELPSGSGSEKFITVALLEFPPSIYATYGFPLSIESTRLYEFPSEKSREPTGTRSEPLKYNELAL